MLISRIARSSALATTLLLLFAAVQPAAAYRETGTTGTVGEHSLTDTRSSPGGDCHYRFEDRGSAWELHDISVEPPHMRAVPGQGTQQVGWRYRVERRYADAFHEDPGPWEHRYTSPVTKTTTDSAHDASFTRMGVRVRVPDDSSEDVWYTYRVFVKAIWYRPNGNVMGTATMRVEWFKTWVGSDTSKQRWSCISRFF